MEAVQRQTGMRIGKRQLGELAIRAALDFEPYYAICSRAPCAIDDVLVITCDAKRIVKRQRPAGGYQQGRCQGKTQAGDPAL